MPKLDRLLRPSSIAVVGGGLWCEAVIRECQALGFAGDIWPIHPKRAEIAGCKSYSCIADLPDIPDAAFIGINRGATIDSVRQLSDLGCGGAVCFASGFREAGHHSLQDQLLDAAGEMPILGPNCYGFLNFLDGCALWPDQHGGRRVDTGVAIIAQSSNIALNLTMQKTGLPIAYILTIGNQAQQGLADIALAALEDPRVTALGLYVEGFGDISTFEALSRIAHERGKSIVVLKVGKSAEAKAATISHTASLAGHDAGANALIERLGFARVGTLSELLQSLKLLHVHGQLSGTKIASLSCSGGEASLMADLGREVGLDFPPVSDAQAKLLVQPLGEELAIANPLDYHTAIWRNKAAMAETFAIMATGAVDLTIIVLDFPRTDRCSDEDWLVTVEAVEEAASNTKRPFAVLSSLSENMPESIAERLMKAGIVPLSEMESALRAIQCVATMRHPNSAVILRVPDQNGATQTLTEYAAKRLLAEKGIVIPKGQCRSSAQLATEDISGIAFPVVLKGQGIAHKTEHGAVALNLNSGEEIRNAAADMGCEQFLIEEMITDTVIELLVGITTDPAHGFLLTLSSGGTLAELLDDQASLLLPTNASEISEKLKTLKVFALAAGYRGKAPANVSAIVQTILALQDYVIENSTEICEVEVNPLVCTPERAVAVDALIVKRTN